MLENDNDYKPVMDFGPLERSKTFYEYNVQKGVVNYSNTFLRATILLLQQ